VFKIDFIIQFIKEYFNSDSYLQGIGFEGSIPDYNFIKGKDNSLGCDYRFSNDDFINSMIPIIVKEKATDKLIYTTCFIVYKEDLFDKVKFWQYDLKNNILNGITLGQLINYKALDVPIISLGFTSVLQETKKKYALGCFLLDILKKVLFNFKPLFIIEPTGILFLNENVKSKSAIKISEMHDKDHLFQSKIGNTKKESLATEKLSEFIGFVQLKDIFNKNTLGKVFVNDYMLNLINKKILS